MSSQIKSERSVLQMIFRNPLVEPGFLRHYGELSFKEIADQTGVSINTALGRMRYAQINLRKMINERELSLTVY